MLNSVRQGLFFGLHSGIITTAGLLFGLGQTKNLTIKYLIINIVSFAIADGSSEAYGMYLSKKAEKKDDKSYEPLYAGLSLGFIKILTVLSFLLPLLFKKNIKFFKTPEWVYLWSTFLLIFINYSISSIRNEDFLKHFIPHIILLIVVTQTTKLLSKILS
jgi:vacuolar iron transporter family protein